jgi:hypothetical protein
LLLCARERDDARLSVSRLEKAKSCASADRHGKKDTCEPDRAARSELRSDGGEKPCPVGADDQGTQQDGSTQSLAHGLTYSRFAFEG